MRSPNFFTYIPFLCLIVLFGCRPVCKMEIPNIDSSKINWFGSEIKLTGLSAWSRVENYSGGSVYLEDINVNILNNCDKCKIIKNNLINDYNICRESQFSNNCKTLKILSRRDIADYTGYFKVVYVKEEPPIAKYPGPLGVSSNVLKFWFKLVDNKNGKIVFGYSSIGPMDSQKDFSNNIRFLINALNNFKINHYSGI